MKYFCKPDEEISGPNILEERSSSKRYLTGWQKQLVYVVSVIMGAFHIVVLGFYPITQYYLYVIHITFGIVLILSIYSARKGHYLKRIPWYDWFFMMLALLSGGYLFSQMESLIYRLGVSPTNLDLIITVILLLLVLEIVRRTTGNTLPIIATIFLIYARFGNYIPGILGHRGYEWDRIISYMAGMDAIFSIPLGASASFVILFVIFSGFLHVSGAGKVFIDLAIGLTGKSRGGPAKAAIVASGFFGTVSGNSMANVVSTGSFTIPLMKKIGYSPRFAGAVEAVASSGGQIVPPIMGAAAFIMAQLIGVSYIRIVQAALIPALLYYIAVFIMVDIEAAKSGLKGMDDSELPNTRQVLKTRWNLLMPLFVLIYVLVILKASPMRAALWGIASVVLASYLRRDTRMTLKKLLEALDRGAKDALSMIAACASAGIVIGVLNLTGSGLKFASAIVLLAKGNLLLALVLTMVASIILGMGLPTTAAYLITAAVVAPALVHMGVSDIAAHMFVFYFACISAITPPVALAAFAGANIAKAKPLEVGITATLLGSTAFIIPYMFVFGEELLWVGTFGELIIPLVSSILGVLALSVGVQGWLYGGITLSMIPRSLLILSALCLLDTGIVTDIIGMVVIVTVLIYNLKIRRDSDA